MDAEGALADLMEISSQVEVAVVLDADGSVAGATAAGERADRLAQAARELVAAAEQVRTPGGERALTQLEAATRAGSVFVVRGDEHTIAATTAQGPTVGLVFYDLTTCLRSLARDGGEAG